MLSIQDLKSIRSLLRFDPDPSCGEGVWEENERFEREYQELRDKISEEIRSREHVYLGRRKTPTFRRNVCSVSEGVSVAND